MSRYPRSARAARVKCLSCNAPAVEVEDAEFICVECGRSPVRRDQHDRVYVERNGIAVEKRIHENGQHSTEVCLTLTSRYELPVAVRLVEPLHETLLKDVKLNGSPPRGEWSRTSLGLAFDGIIEPGTALETGYAIPRSRRNPHLIARDPSVDRVKIVDETAVDDGSVPRWQGDTTVSDDDGGTPTVPERPVLRAPAADGGSLGVEIEEVEPPTLRSEVDSPALPGALDERPSVKAGAEEVSPYLLPPDSAATPDISVVLPTMNEEEGIGPCIEAVVNALETLEIHGEVVVSDSSTDRTPEIARQLGAKVIHPEEKGYGAAYKYGFAHARGEYIVMGDADTTYDFEELPDLFERLQSGEADMVMGSRFAGEIKPGAMPWLHRRIGNPALTAFLNTFYAADVTDAHSGFRVLTREALDALELHSDGMEFASEMVMAAGERGLTIDEVPITYHPRVGEAKLESLSDGWRHVKFMLTNTPTHVFSIPAVGLSMLGLVLMGLSVLDAQVFGLTMGLHAVIAGSLLTIVGYQVASLAVFSAVAGTAIRNPSDPVTGVIRDHFKLEHGATLGVAMYGVGMVYVAAMTIRWLSSGGRSLPFVDWNMVAFTFIVLGVQTVFYSFFLSQLGQRMD